MPQAKYTKRLLLGTVSAVMLLTGTPLSSVAQAQKARILEPLSRWDVSSVESSKAGGRPYCAMARRYNENLILTVAQNRSHEASLALDFQSPSFKKQQVFTVVLDPGAGEVREFETRPASSRAFVIRLGDDKSFFSALYKTGFLRVVINEKTYHFDIRDIEKGKAQIDNCVASLDDGTNYSDKDGERFAEITPAAGGAAVPAPSVVKSENYEVKLASLKDDLDRLRQEKFRLEETLEKERGFYSEQKFGSTAPVPVDDVIEPPAGDLQKPSGDVETKALSNEIALLEEQNERLLGKIAEMSSVAVASAEAVTQTNAQITKVAETVVDAAVEPPQEVMKQVEPVREVVVKEAPVKVMEDSSALAGLRSEMEALRSKNEALMRDIENIRQQTIEEFTDKLAAQRSENEALKMALGQSVEGAGAEDNAADPIVRMQRSVMALEKEKEDLRAKLEALNAVNAAMKEEIEGVRLTEAELEDMKIRNKELEAQIAASLSASEGMINAQETEMSTEFSGKIQQLEVINEELHVALDKAQKETEAVEKQRISQQAVLDALKEENKNLRQKLASAQSVGADPERLAQLVEQNKELKGSVSVLQTELQQMRAEMARLQRFVDAPESADEAVPEPIAENTAQEMEIKEVERLAKAQPEAVEQVASAPEVVTEKVVEAVKTVAPEPVKLPSGEYLNQAQRYEAELMNSMQKSAAAPLVDAPEAKPLPAAANEVEVAQMDKVEVFEPVAGQGKAGAPLPLKSPEEASVETVQSQSAVLEKELQQKLAVNDMARSFEPSIDMQHLLNDAHVAIGEQVEKIDNRKTQGRLAYRWQAGGVFGSAELKPINTPGQFESYVYDYLNITEKRCDGDFAIVPERIVESGTLRLDSYEIACIGGSVDSTASLLFFSKNNTFSVVAQEASMEQMPMVMDARDRIITTLKKSS